MIYGTGNILIMNISILSKIAAASTLYTGRCTVYSDCGTETPFISVSPVIPYVYIIENSKHVSVANCGQQSTVTCVYFRD